MSGPLEMAGNTLDFYGVLERKRAGCPSENISIIGRQPEFQYTALPPDASNVKPVVKLHSGEAINAANAATSSTFPVRCIGIN